MVRYTRASFTQGNLLLRENSLFSSGGKKSFTILEQEVSFITIIKRKKHLLIAHVYYSFLCSVKDNGSCCRFFFGHSNRDKHILEKKQCKQQIVLVLGRCSDLLMVDKY